MEIRVPASSVRTRMSMRKRNPNPPCHSGRALLLLLCERTNMRRVTAADLNAALRKVLDCDPHTPGGGGQHWFVVHCIARCAPDWDTQRDMMRISRNAVMGSELADICAVYDIVFYD
jgi:hypothetical protein